MRKGKGFKQPFTDYQRENFSLMPTEVGSRLQVCSLNKSICLEARYFNLRHCLGSPDCDVSKASSILAHSTMKKTASSIFSTSSRSYMATDLLTIEH